MKAAHANAAAVAAELQQMGNAIIAKNRAANAAPKLFTILVECDHVGGYSMRAPSNSARGNRFTEQPLVERCLLCGDTGRKSHRIPYAEADFIDECAFEQGLTRTEFLEAEL